MRTVVVAVVALAACGQRDVTYHWDDQRVLCSMPLDDLAKTIDFADIDSQLDTARDDGSVAVVHAHKPGETVSMAALERVFTDADARGLDTISFRELDAGTSPRAALAFAFDDNSPELWITVRDLLAAHNARITLFVTRWATMTDEQHAQVEELASDGHDLEPHGVAHLNAVDYVAAHGIDAYLDDDVLPSFTPLTQLGYTPTVFAYPFGAHTAQIDDAVLQHVSRVRAVMSDCE